MRSFLVVTPIMIVVAILGFVGIVGILSSHQVHAQVEEPFTNEWIEECAKDSTSFWHEKEKKYYNITHEVSKQACQDAWPFRKQQ
jgi:hypothetical protein